VHPRFLSLLQFFDVTPAKFAQYISDARKLTFHDEESEKAKQKNETKYEKIKHYIHNNLLVLGSFALSPTVKAVEGGRNRRLWHRIIQ